MFCVVSVASNKNAGCSGHLHNLNKFSETYMIFICIDLMVSKDSFPSKNMMENNVEILHKLDALAFWSWNLDVIIFWSLNLDIMILRPLQKCVGILMPKLFSISRSHGFMDLESRYLGFYASTASFSIATLRRIIDDHNCVAEDLHELLSL